VTHADNGAWTPKVWALHPVRDRWSSLPQDYAGQQVLVSCATERQAGLLAYRRQWIDSTAPGPPVGVISIYHRDRGIEMWCGCSGLGLRAGRIRVGATAPQIQQFISNHERSCPNVYRTQLVRRHLARLEMQP
jgi:hypothetical protein